MGNDQNAVPENKPSGEHKPRPADRPLWKKIFTPAVLGVIGFTLIVVAYKVLPGGGQNPTPAYATVVVTTKTQVLTYDYAVSQDDPSDELITIKLIRPILDISQPAGDVIVDMYLPPGVDFQSCPKPDCFTLGGSEDYSLAGGFDKPGLISTFYFSIKAHNFGYTTDGVNASVALPELQYQGPGNVRVTDSINIPSASSYDWSSFPTSSASSTGASWEEQLLNGEVPARVAVGINHSAQANDDHRNFLAGAIIGIAGGALLGAVQEGLHANDD